MWLGSFSLSQLSSTPVQCAINREIIFSSTFVHNFTTNYQTFFSKIYILKIYTIFFFWLATHRVDQIRLWSHFRRLFLQQYVKVLDCSMTIQTRNRCVTMSNDQPVLFQPFRNRDFGIPARNTTTEIQHSRLCYVDKIWGNRAFRSDNSWTILNSSVLEM